LVWGGIQGYGRNRKKKKPRTAGSAENVHDRYAAGYRGFSKKVHFGELKGKGGKTECKRQNGGVERWGGNLFRGIEGALNNQNPDERKERNCVVQR